MDGLNDYQRAVGWLWNLQHTPEAIALVGKDLKIFYVNPSLCELLRITPAQMINSSFADITPEPYKTEDVRNAKLVISGQVIGYEMIKEYQFSAAHIVKVSMLVHGVRDPITDEFLYFISKLTLPEEIQKAKREAGISATQYINTFWGRIGIGIAAIGYVISKAVGL